MRHLDEHHGIVMDLEALHFEARLFEVAPVS
jgi:hypothetical protein